MYPVTRRAAILFATAGALLQAAAARAQGKVQTPSPKQELNLSVAAAKNGFTPAQAKTLLSGYTYEESLKSGDVAMFFFLNVGQLLGTAQISRVGNVGILETAPNPGIGATLVQGALGMLSLNEYLVDQRSRAQGMIVAHQGRIIFEQYPGMRDFDNKAWMSVSKTTVALVIALLAQQGKIDVQKPVELYFPALRGTDWAGTSVQDVLDMSSGMDILETQDNRLNPRSTIARFFLAANGMPNADGEIETQLDVIKSAKREKPPGQSFDYSSINTMVLVLLAEAVETKRWPDIFQEYVWSKMVVEGDMLAGISPDGEAQAYGLLTSRLRDMARYGMLYTPSWHLAAREQIVSETYLHDIRSGKRKDIFLNGELGNRLTASYFPKSPPVANAWQWDGVFADGDIYKGGVFGQGLYVSPGKDLVIVYYSTTPSTDLTQYARQIATSWRASPA